MVAPVYAARRRELAMEIGLGRKAATATTRAAAVPKSGKKALAPKPAKAGRPSTNGKLSLRSEEHTSELQALMRISYAVFCLNKKTKKLERSKPCDLARD